MDVIATKKMCVSDTLQTLRVQQKASMNLQCFSPFLPLQSLSQFILWLIFKMYFFNQHGFTVPVPVYTLCDWLYLQSSSYFTSHFQSFTDFFFCHFHTALHPSACGTSKYRCLTQMFVCINRSKLCERQTSQKSWMHLLSGRLERFLRGESKFKS